jgi:hypothetical protein
VLFCLESVFNNPILTKFHIYPFSQNYDVLLGHETLKHINAKINFENNKLEYTNGSKDIVLEQNTPITIEPGLNVINIPVKQCNTIGLIKERQIGKCKILEGLVNVRNYECNCVIESPERTVFYPTPMEIDEVEIVKKNKNIDKNNLDELENLVRTDHMNEDERIAILNLIKKYSQIVKFANEPLGSTNLLKHTIKTKNDDPIYSRNYRYPIAFKKDIKIEIDKLLKDNIIRPSNSPYNSPVWIVPKKPDASGKRKVRLVIDYRKLNNNTIDDKFPLPNIEDLLGKIGRATYFSALDLASGFHQIEVEPESIPKTAFSTEDGHYEFLRMPFGLKNAPPTFQRAMNIIFAHMPNVLVYMDDIIIFSDNLTEHLKHLESVFKQLSHFNLKLQLDKTEFFKRELLYLGHVISEEGIKPNPLKLAAIKEFPLPKNAKEIKQFLGLTGYYRKMIRDYAKIAKPLTQALRKDVPVNIKDREYIKAFNHLKELLQNEPILKLPDFSKSFILTTDASNFALGAVLSQNHSNHDLPVAYASRTLNRQEVNLSTIEKELLSIVWACKHFRPYLYGRKFIIQTDHKPLQWLNNLKEPNSKLMRWKLTLEEFDFDIRYIEGRSNKVADALSRVEIPNEPDVHMVDSVDLNPDEVLDNFLKSENNDECNDDTFSLITIHSQESSNDLCAIMDQDRIVNIEQNQIILEKGTSCHKYEKIFNKNRITIYLSNRIDLNCNLDSISKYLKPNTTYGILNKTNNDTLLNDFKELILENFDTIKLKIYKKINLDIVDLEEQKTLVENYHCAKTYHRGINENYSQIRKRYYWPSMLNDVTRYVNNCNTCQQIKYERKPIRLEYKETPTPCKPFDRLQIDTFHYDGTKILTIIDTFSKRLTAYTLKTLNQNEIKRKLLNYLALFPIPQTIQMDNGTEFNNSTIKNLLLSYKIEPYYVSANHSDSQGLIERSHSTLLELLNIVRKEERNISIKDALDLSIIAYNNTLNQKHKLTPNEMTYGIGKIDFLNDINGIEMLEMNAKENTDRLSLLHKVIKERIIKEKQERTEKLNKDREKTPELRENENIMLKATHHRKAKEKYFKAKHKNPNIAITKRMSFKYHPSRLKRPRKLRENPSVSGKNEDPSPNSGNADSE